MSLFEQVRRKMNAKKVFHIQKRKFIRANGHFLIKYKVLDHSEEMSYAKNISGCGLCLYSREKLQIGDIIRVKINFPKYPKPIQTVARVVRVQPHEKTGGYEIGVEFENIEDSARDFLIEKIQEMKNK